MRKLEGREETNSRNRKAYRRRNLLGLKITLIVVALLMVTAICVLAYINKKYTIQNIMVEGNVHYTSEEIIDRVMSGKLDHNSLYLSMKYKWHDMETIPFVAAIEIEIQTADTVKITVYEKSLAGYVTYLDRFMYFDKDGTVVESSKIRMADVPEVKGLSFDHVVMEEQLPVENEEVFQQVLNITQSMEKYDLSADKVYFDRNYNITLYFGNIRVEMGNMDYIDEKFSRLQTILPNLEGKSGVLSLNNFTTETKIIPFQQDKTE